jgi:hypothetical protein
MAPSNSVECALAVRIVQLEYEMVPPAALFDPASSPLTSMPIRCAAPQTLARCRLVQPRVGARPRITC